MYRRLDAALLGAEHVHTASDLAAIGQVLCPARSASGARLPP